MYLALATYFAAGILTSGLSASYVSLISKGRALAAAVVVFLNVCIAVAIVVNIVSGISENGIAAIILYSLGNASGTYVSTKFHSR